MKAFFLLAVSASVAIGSFQPARAGCIISPDQKSINVVTDNPSSDEKNCAVNCKVDTPKGVAQISCGGNAPPLAKGYSLCDYDKPERWYFKVLSSEDSCAKGAEAAPTSAPPPPAKQADGFECRISADGHSVDAMIANPYASATSCQVDCQISTTKPGTTLNVSCSKTVEPGAGKVAVCTESFDKGRLVKMLGGKGSCVNPAADDDAPKDDTQKDDASKDDDADMQSLVNDAQKKMQKMMKELDK
jgi:hypothetical protein